MLNFHSLFFLIPVPKYTHQHTHNHTLITSINSITQTTTHSKYEIWGVTCDEGWFPQH